MTSTRRQLRDLDRQAKRLSRDMGRYTDTELSVLASNPPDRAQMERVLADARSYIDSVGAQQANPRLVREAERLQRALAAPGILA